MKPILILVMALAMIAGGAPAGAEDFRGWKHRGSVHITNLPDVYVSETGALTELYHRRLVLDAEAIMQTHEALRQERGAAAAKKAEGAGEPAPRRLVGVERRSQLLAQQQARIAFEEERAELLARNAGRVARLSELRRDATVPLRELRRRDREVRRLETEIEADTARLLELEAEKARARMAGLQATLESLDGDGL